MWAQKQCLLFLSYENTWATGILNELIYRQLLVNHRCTLSSFLLPKVGFILNTKKPIMHPNYIKQVLKSGHGLDADTSIMHE